MNMFDAAV